jgi:hypothetical protein
MGLDITAASNARCLRKAIASVARRLGRTTAATQQCAMRNGISFR